MTAAAWQLAAEYEQPSEQRTVGLRDTRPIAGWQLNAAVCQTRPKAESPKPKAFAFVLCPPARPCYVSVRSMNSHRFVHLALHALVIGTGSRSAGL